MRTVIQSLIILGILIAFGTAKLRFEDNLSHQMVEEKLLQPPLEKGVTRKLDQTTAAIAFGGMRSLVASILNFRAFLHFEELDWIKLEETYGTIVSLQPQTTHYWETGAWHLHTNAAVHYKEQQDLAPFRRNSLRELYHTKGSDFLEEGIRQNPNNWRLHTALARVWSDRHKFPDYEKAVKHYQGALTCSPIPDYKLSQYKRFTFYNMCNIPDRRSDALALGLELFYESDSNHTPVLVTSIFALQNELTIPMLARIPDNQLFPDKAKQLAWLKNHWKRQLPETPVAGVQETIKLLEGSPSF